MVTLKFAWATVRRNELVLELAELQKEIDFLLGKDFTSVISNDKVDL